jgi:cell division protein FtsA
MNTNQLSADDIVFGLDIGTRTVIGLVGYKKDEKFYILSSKVIAHESRAMIDGQIHDIGKVAKVVSEVKQALETITGFKFKKVAIAAAGRSLKTINVSVEQHLDRKNEFIIDSDTIKALEVEGINKAQTELVKGFLEEEKYFCVGYSVVNYYLNGYTISNLEGHKAGKIAADILATFLPQEVVDSLYAVIESIGLEVGSMTLEPIAAINVVIPENLRLLNLALVDVGAGTSDIAVTKDGSVSAYGMIPIAGDEVTEQLVHKYLIDFQTGEAIKQQIATCEQVTFEDILGISHKVSKAELLASIEPAVERLTTEVAAKICAVNAGKSASAVFCVGGGSQVPGFIEKLAQKLELPQERVIIRGSEALVNIAFAENEDLKGPMYVTPIGICVTSAMETGYKLIYVTINGDIVELMGTKELTLLNAAMAKGYNHTNLMNRKGSNLLFRLNGSIKKISGNLGTPAELYINGQLASLDSTIAEDDKIIIVPSVNGSNARAFVKDFINEYKIKNIQLNGTPMKLSAFAMINGNTVSIEQEIVNDDEVYICKIDTIKDLCQYSEINLNDKIVYINNAIVSEESSFKDGDVIAIKSKYEDKAVDQVTAQIVPEIKEDEIKGMEVKESKVEIISEIKNSIFSIPMQVMVNGEPVRIEDNKKSYIFVDIFNYIDFDLSKPKGIITLMLNGRKANYTDPLKNGDYITISWESI